MTTPLIHIVDDDVPVRQSLAFLLVTAGYVVRLHASPSHLLGDGALEDGCCVITDFSMPEMDGIDLIKSLRAQGRNLPAILMSGSGDLAMIVAAMKAGAIDFVEKPFSDAALLRAVRKASDAYSDGYGQVLGADDRRLSDLTAGERRLLEAIANGMSTRAIADQLDISLRSADLRRAGLMSKLRVDTLPELLRLAFAE